ncbi:unnamed protein product, partial [Effrenium voratum]
VVLGKAEEIRQAQAKETLEFRLLLVSGCELGSVEVPRLSSVADVKAAAAPLLDEGRFVSKLIWGSSVLEDDDPIESSGASHGAVLQAVLQQPAYLVTSAGKEE